MKIDINEIMKNQPIVNIGMIGHVSHGKSTIVKALTGKTTQQHEDEKHRNITIRLGYANAKIFKCSNCEPPSNCASAPSHINNLKCKICGNEMELVVHISTVDSPGHSSLMSTMLNGTSVMDSTILTVSINEDNIPAPQTVQHVMATEIANLPNLCVCANKIDLSPRHEAERRLKKLQKYLENTICEDSPIIPVVATLGINMDVLCYELCKLRDTIINKKCYDNIANEPCKMIIIRSFNVNKPGTAIKDLKGGVIGGSILSGMIKVNDDVVIKPGFILKNVDYDEKNENINQKRWKYQPIQSKILSIYSENNKLDYAISGGLIGVQLDIDPSFAADDGMIGNVMMSLNEQQNYGVYEDIELEYTPITNKELKVDDLVFVNANANNSRCCVMRYKKNKLILKMISGPVCMAIDDMVTISAKSHNNEGIVVIGRGKLLDGNPCGEI